MSKQVGSVWAHVSWFCTQCQNRSDHTMPSGADWNQEFTTFPLTQRISCNTQVIGGLWVFLQHLNAAAALWKAPTLHFHFLVSSQSETELLMSHQLTGRAAERRHSDTEPPELDLGLSPVLTVAELCNYIITWPQWPRKTWYWDVTHYWDVTRYWDVSWTKLSWIDLATTS